MTAGEADTAGVLGRLLAEKITIFNDLNSATGALCESFSRQDFGEIERLIAARGELAARADGIDDRIRGLNVKLPSYIAGLKGAGKDRIQSLVRELQDVTKEAVDLDSNCTKAAAAAFESLGSDISRMRQEKHNFNSYSGQDGRTKILDIKS